MSNHVLLLARSYLTGQEQILAGGPQGFATGGSKKESLVLGGYHHLLLLKIFKLEVGKVIFL